MQRHQQHKKRAQGILGTPMVALAVLAGLLIAGYSIAFAHVALVKTQLQDAVDAAALSGAANLQAAPDRVEADALKLATANFADGARVSNRTPGTGVTVEVMPGDDANPGCVKVQATRRVKFVLSGICGLPASTVVRASAVSGASGRVTTVYRDQLFPLAISINVCPMDRMHAEQPLAAHCLGDSITLLTNAQQTRNVSFTTFFHPANDANYLLAALQQALGMKQNGAGFVPKVSIGDTINLNNGVSGTHFLALGDQSGALSRRPIITMPVIKGNPQYEDKATVIGFVSARVEGYTLNPAGQELNSLNVRLVKGQVRGLCKKLPGTGNAVIDDALVELSAGIVKLLPDNSIDKRVIATSQSQRRTRAQSVRQTHYRPPVDSTNAYRTTTGVVDAVESNTALPGTVASDNSHSNAALHPAQVLQLTPGAPKSPAKNNWPWIVLLLLLNGFLVILIWRHLSSGSDSSNQSTVARVRRKIASTRRVRQKRSQSFTVTGVRRS